MIELKQVSLTRGGVSVLHDVSLNIPAGAITVVVGRSGVGKSTLIGSLNGLFRPSCGDITVNGIGPLRHDRAWQAHRRQTATVFQEHALIDRLSALDNVLLGLADQRHPLSPLPWPQALQLRAASALDDVGLLAHAHDRVARLSGGERQRVGVARALVRQPQLLLGDEPFSAVDPSLVAHLGHTLRQQVQQHGLTVVLVMHQMDIALALADKVVALVDGRVAFDGPATAFDRDRQAQVFARTPASPTVPSGTKSVRQ